MKVLLVEDHPAMRFAVRTLLQRQEDVDVVGEAGNAAEGLRLTRRLKPDLVILDLSLPGEPGGVEACREMKALPDPPRVLVYTAYNSREEIYSCFLCGADSYVHKSEEPTKLVQTIRETHAGKKVWLMGGEVEETASHHLRAAADKASLTSREKEVMSLMVRGYANARIAGELSIALPTVKTHVGNILKKLDLKSRGELS
jgi:DNA-binding NarL/FixJ family response regulator